jgi:hypothetical protein
LIYRLQLRADAIVPEFLVYQLLSRVGRGQIERDARGSSGTMPKISPGHIKSWRVLRPPAREQPSSQYYLDLILALVREHAPITRAEVDQAVIPKLPDRLTQQQKQRKVHNLLQELRRARKIDNRGSRGQPAWYFTGESVDG